MRLVIGSALVGFCLIGTASSAWGEPGMPSPAAVVAAVDAPLAERLAAKEVARYYYLRTGKLLPIAAAMPADKQAVIVVASKERALLEGLGDDALRAAIAALGPEQYLLKTVRQGERSLALVIGGDAVGTLYGAYRLAEKLGVRFYLHGDVVPDGCIAPAIPALDESGKPLFDRRGIQPFHDFPEGPDWWDADGYKAVLGQLPKLRMNFFGLHTYPQGSVGPEPLTWIGRREEIGEGPQVKASYPSRHYTTLSGTWGYRAKKTGDYLFGAAELFPRDDYGTDYMRGMTPWPKTEADQNELFRRMGVLTADAFGLARQLGIKTCLGTETPLTIPDAVKNRLKASGKDPADPAVVREVYEGMFARIAQTHPLDYYWFWTPEEWTWNGATEAQTQSTLADFRAAIAAAEKVKAPFTLATCGWVLGPPQQPALFDQTLPKVMPMSCINRAVGNTPVERGFAQIKDRPKWAIPWMEDDPGLTTVQLWVGRMRKDAADALAYGCTGLLGIHWRTRVLGPNVAALAAAAWDQQGWSPPPKPAAPPEGPAGGAIVRFANRPIAGTDEAAVYQSLRCGMEGYTLHVPNGKYAVTLKFCEPMLRERGQRVFSVHLQGKPAVERLDIFEKAGGDRALDYTFKDVAVDGGRLSVQFVPQIGDPVIAGIVVEGPAKQKINCGGQAHKDYRADWDVAAPESNRYAGAADFYADWAAAEFGPEAAPKAAALLTRLDCRLPRPCLWTDGPGGLAPEAASLQQVNDRYAFVEELAALRPLVRGPGNLERFDYWLDSFRFIRSLAQGNVAWRELEDALAKAAKENDAAARARAARELALPAWKAMVERYAEAAGHLAATISTPGELGTVANLQQHALPAPLGLRGKLEKLLGGPLATDAEPSKSGRARPRLIVPTVRTMLRAGEPLALTVIVAGGKPADAALLWRPLGGRAYTRVPLDHVARGVYTVMLPAPKGDLEYYVEANVEGVKLVFPATAPAMPQTVVVVVP